MAIPIHVNGKSVRVPEAMTLAALVAERGFRPGTVAVEHNEEIVDAAKWADTVLQAGDEVEIVQFMGGGC